MKVHQDLHTLPVFTRPVLTIGSFDGVHLGHRRIIQQLINHALNGESILITFEPHPRLVINPGDKTLKLLNTLQEKINLLSELGLHHLVVVPFDDAFRALTAKEYIADFIIKKFKPSTLIIGYDHHFGNNREGNLQLLKDMQSDYNYEVTEIPKQEIDDLAVSSTKIRNYLQEGNMNMANQMLVQPYSISGTVVHGDARGRTIGYPTANLSLHHRYKLIPGNGVYAIRAQFQGKHYGGMMNIGTRPTIESTQKISLEAHLFDFDKQIYDEFITVQIISKLRNEMKFNGIEELIGAIRKDEYEARLIVNY
jgi:riboflavin kinase / FMN adenylyltransferase